MTKPGRLITFEGGEGVGKSTQVARLVARLQANGREVVGTREPGGSPKAEAIRTMILSGAVAPFGSAAEAMMFAAARADHVANRIRPALHRGAWVVCDRFTDSTRAYQGAAGHVDPRLIAALELVAVGSTRPDLTLVLDVPGRVGLERVAARRARSEPADRFEQEDEPFHDRLRQAFLAIAVAEPERCAVIDATGRPDEVAAAVWHVLETRMPETLRTAAA